MNKITKYLGFPADPAYRIQIEQNLTSYIFKTHTIFQLLILGCQILMLYSISVLPGGVFLKPRRTAYFCMYILLIFFTVLSLAVKAAFRRKIMEHYRMFGRMELFYTILICFWSTAVTLNDQLGGNGLNVFIYMSLIAAAAGLLKPWQSVLLFGCNFLILNALLPYFPDPYGADQSFNNMTNSFFITVLCIGLSITLYRNRVLSEYDRIIIGEQYQKIAEINEELNQQVIRDRLTGLFNRSYMETVLKEQFRSVQDKCGNIACMMIDIDYFKQYNDRFGHISGDECLRTFAGFLEKEVQNRSGSLIRYGGEEFLIFLFGQDADAAEEIAEHMRRSAESGGYISDGPDSSPVTVSIGVYKECPSAETPFKEFITLADSALYEAKRCGRNCVKLKTGELSQQT